MKIGLVARADNTGLGMLSWEFFENLREYMAKVIIYDGGAFQIFPERFDNPEIITKDQIPDDFLEGIDLILAIETPYDWSIFGRAKTRGIKTVLIPMFECNQKPLEAYPDLIVCPSQIDFESFWGELARLEILPLPVNRKRVSFKLRQKARVFLHNVGHGGLHGRTGTGKFLKAIEMVKTNVRFLIHSQIKIPKVNDVRVEIRIGNLKNYWDLWQRGDVYVFPTNQEMISMPVQEALAAGMPVLMPKFSIYDFPDNWIISSKNKFRAKIIDRFMNFFEIEPRAIAEKIDEWANRDITGASKIADKLASTLDWRVLKSEWIELLKSIL